ncbi:MAG: hypothetical protein NXI20_14835 [bacterium]|nr:hypothetical protein [bacterium]
MKFVIMNKEQHITVMATIQFKISSLVFWIMSNLSCIPKLRDVKVPHIYELAY